MNWLQANRKLARLGCNEAVVTVLAPTGGVPPPNNAPASVVYRRKVAEKSKPYDCQRPCSRGKL